MTALNAHRTAISDAYYCTECTRLEKDRDGCPRIVNVSHSQLSVRLTGTAGYF